MKLSLCLCLALASFSGLARAAKDDWPELVLDDRVLTLSSIAADLSAMAYANEAMIANWTILDDQGEVQGYEHPDYDEISFYTQEPDQAIVAKKDGRCYLAFRGTNLNLADWQQNADLSDIDIYKDNDVDSGLFCEARNGFADFLKSEPVVRGRADLGACVDTCADPDDCLVITGHSQGGATATIASITLYSLNPTLITFGQPPTLDAGCEFIPSDRYYRYVNSMKDIGQDDDMGFDLVVFAPTFVSKSEHYGYFILLGEDPANVMYLGFDQDYDFGINFFDNQANAHTMSGQPYGYTNRIENLLNSYPNIGLDGFSTGYVCEEGYKELCQSGMCNEYQCLPIGGLTETCIKNSCEEDAHCAGDLVCIYDACAAADGEVELGCPCRVGFSQCANETRCQFVDLLAGDSVCGGDDDPASVTNLSMFAVGFILLSYWFN